MPSGIPQSGINKGWYKKGSVGPWRGQKRPEMTGANHPAWVGGKPKCWCGKQLSSYGNVNCQEHSFSSDRIEKIKRGAVKRRGKLHHAWKGDAVSYRGIHVWVVNNFGQPDKCESCETVSTGHSMHWANISREYKRERSDWKRLCTKCHGKFDTGHKRKLKVKQTI